MRHPGRCFAASIPLVCSALLTVSSAIGAARPDFDLSGQHTASAAAVARLERLRVDPALTAIGAIVHVDDRYAVPNLVTATTVAGGRQGAGDAALRRSAAASGDAARAHLRSLAPYYRLDAADIANAPLRDVHDTGVGGIIATFDQELEGVPVFREDVKVLMDRSLGLMAVSGHVPGAGELTSRQFAKTTNDAVLSAIADMAETRVDRSAVRSLGAAEGGYERFTVSGVGTPAGIGASEPIRARRVWYHMPEGLVPAYEVDVMADDEAASYVVAASDGRVLMRHDLIAHDSFTYRVWADNTSLHLPLDGPQGNAATPHPTGLPDLYSPAFLAPSLVTLQNGPISTNDPWLAPGATQTSGNNVAAYADIQAPDGYSGADFMATTTSANTFDRIYDVNQQPAASTNQRMAAITQLFYLNNMLHDWFYDAGFNEAARNAQVSNFGRGGVGGDPIHAEAQDYSGYNNADMATPPDGGSPREQMYVWYPTPLSQLTVNAPASIAGAKANGPCFTNPSPFNLTANVAVPSPGTWTSSGQGPLPCGTGPEWVNLADFTGDGLADLATANFGSNDVTIQRSLGGGQFQSGGSFATGAGPYMVITPDLNHDGRPDLVSANFTGNSISVRLGAAGGTFNASKTDYATGNGSACLAVGRFNADANDDIVVANYSASTVSILLGNGTGGFSGLSTLPTGVNPNWVAVGDLNNDGFADIVTANAGSNTVSTRLGNGTGNFAAANNYVCGNTPLTLALGDLNGDGKVDVVTANNSDNTIAVLLGNGLGGFGGPTTYAVPATPVTVTLGQLNGDGILDAAVCSDASNSVTVFYGNGAGGLVSPVNRPTGTAPYAVQIADVTGDGDPDLVTANFGSNNLTVIGGAVTAPTWHCPPAANTLAGRIALVNYDGSCDPYTMMQAAEQAGAAAVLMSDDLYSYVAGFPPYGPLTIPAYFIPPTAAAAIHNALRSGSVSITLNYVASQQRSGELDNLIAAHEWGHHLSNRLIGNANGLYNNQGNGMGEGWSDFVALLMSVKPEDAAVGSNAGWNGVFAACGYDAFSSAVATNVFYYGVRRYPYSCDMTKDPLTFADIQNSQALPVGPPRNDNGYPNADVHNTGEVWCTALWECYAALLRDTNRLTFTQARDRMRQYLVASLKLTPIAPTFIEARDALLLAALSNDLADYQAFGTAFAKRGMGTGAQAPFYMSSTNNGVVESFVFGGDLTLVSMTYGDSLHSCDNDGYLDNGEDAFLTLKLSSPFPSSTLNGTTMTVSTTNPNLGFPGGATVSMPPSVPLGTTFARIRVQRTGTSTSLEDLRVQYNDPLFVPAGPRRLPTLFRWGNVDEQGGTSETFETLAPPWTTSGPVLSSANAPWTIVVPDTTTNNHVYFAPAPANLSDQRLVSPVLFLGAGSHGFTFKHAFSFEVGNGGGGPAYFDGGVVEITTDGGANWTDIGSSISLGYGGLLSASNPLGARMAFVGTSANYPALQTATATLGPAYDGKTVQIRFRLGANASVGGGGWTIDDLVFTGIGNNAFKTLVPDPGPCVPLAVDEPQQPTELSFALASANPTSGDPLFRFALPAPARVKISVFDISGRMVATLTDRDYTAGTYSARWAGSDGSRGEPGVYFARMIVGGRVLNRRVVVLAR